MRAGILGEAPTLPQLFFPTVVAIDKTTKKESVGFEVAKPSVRADNDIIFPVRPSIKVDKVSTKIYMKIRSVKISAYRPFTYIITEVYLDFRIVILSYIKNI